MHDEGHTAFEGWVAGAASWGMSGVGLCALPARGMHLAVSADLSHFTRRSNEHHCDMETARRIGKTVDQG